MTLSVPASLFGSCATSVLGMQLFGGKLPPPDEDIPRYNFDSLLWSFLTVFQVGAGVRAGS